MAHPNFNTKKGNRIDFNKEKKVERNQRADEMGLTVSFWSGGNNGEHNGRTVLIPWETIKKGSGF